MSFCMQKLEIIYDSHYTKWQILMATIFYDFFYLPSYSISVNVMVKITHKYHNYHHNQNMRQPVLDRKATDTDPGV